MAIEKELISDGARLYCSDCIDAFVCGVIDCVVDAIVVDLPYYGIVKDEFDNQWRNVDDYIMWVMDGVKRGCGVLKDGGAFVLFCSRQNVHKIAIACSEIGLVEQRMIVWCRKRCFNNTRGKALASGYEPILYMTKGCDGITFNNLKLKVESDRKEYSEGVLRDGVSLSDCWTDISALPHNSRERVAHPTQKPVKLMRRIIEMVSNTGDCVLDYCMGSGSTGVACLESGRRFIGIEKDCRYYNLAVERISGCGACKQMSLF